jgi:hypothetical protein
MATDSSHLNKDLISDTTQVTIRRSLSLTMVEPPDEQAGYESINSISMLYPSLDKPIIYILKTTREDLPCSIITDKTPMVKGEKCYNNNKTKSNDEFILAI